MAEILKTLNPAGGGDYTLMSVAEATDQQDLTVGNTYVLECYDGAITDTVWWSGWTTDATNFITIRPASGNGHGGVFGAGFSISAAVGATQYVFRTSAAYSVIDGITVTSSNTSPIANYAIGVSSFGSISNCFFTAGIENTAARCLSNTIDNTGTVINCVAINGAYGFYAGNYDRPQWLNCTAINQVTGAFRREGTGGTGVTVRNCVAYSTTGAAWVGTDFVGNNNASWDSTAFGTSPQTLITTTDFADFAGGDYSPASGGKLAGTGADLSTSFTTDIAGATRTVPWTIGSWIVGGAPPVGIQEMYVNIGGTFTKATPSVLVGGVWQPADAYVLVAGVWKLVYER